MMRLAGPVMLCVAAVACGDAIPPPAPPATASQPGGAAASEPDAPGEPAPQPAGTAVPGAEGPAPAPSDGAATAEPEQPGEPRPDLAARSSACDIKVTGVSNATNVGGGVGQASCTWELMINGVRYRYVGEARLKGRPAKEACGEAQPRIERAARTATSNCKDLTITDRQGRGLQPLN